MLAATELEGRKARNPNIEFRNKFELPNGRNDQNETQQVELFRIFLLGHLVIVSTFGFRISSFRPGDDDLRFNSSTFFSLHKTRSDVAEGQRVVILSGLVGKSPRIAAARRIELVLSGVGDPG